MSELASVNDSNTRAARGSGDRPAVMTDVAKLAGVSHQTVSRVLNDSPQVRPETRERVLAAVAELGYRPNAMARGLVSRRSKVLGVVTFDTILYGPACMLLGIERAARAAGYGVSIVTLERVDRAGVLAAVDTLAGQGVDGVIIIAPQIAAAAALHNLPARPVAVAVEAGQDAPLPSAAVDQFEGARLAPCGTCSTSGTRPSGTCPARAIRSRLATASRAGGAPSPRRARPCPRPSAATGARAPGTRRA